ncbi:MAG: hypothetical protein LBL05_00920 [Synergistaceae bacterium]|nr:hypothetical protein [Synergistaceae bacterium]
MEESSPRDLKKPKKRAGFSLIIVMVISMIGVAIVGAAIQFTAASGGAGRVTNTSGKRYNLLQEAVEEGKAKLMEKMDNINPIPRHAKADADDEPPIGDLGRLLVTTELDGPEPGVVKEQDISSSELRRLGILDAAGRGGKLKVSIYDMQYEPTIVAASISAEDLRMLPPSIIIDPARWRLDGDTKLADEKDKAGAALLNTGAYLVRAELRIGDRVSVLDSAVLQSNNM